MCMLVFDSIGSSCLGVDMCNWTCRSVRRSGTLAQRKAGLAKPTPLYSTASSTLWRPAALRCAYSSGVCVLEHHLPSVPQQRLYLQTCNKVSSKGS